MFKVLHVATQPFIAAGVTQVIPSLCNIFPILKELLQISVSHTIFVSISCLLKIKGYNMCFLGDFTLKLQIRYKEMNSKT